MLKKLLIISFLIFSTFDISIAQTWVLEKIYSDDFSGSSNSWYSVKSTNAAWTGSVYSWLDNFSSYSSVSGTFWLDQNHIYPEGKGTLNLWAFTYPKELGLQKHNFSKNILKLRVRANNLRISQTSKIGLWFQVFDPLTNRYVNYFQKANRVDTALGYPDISSRTGSVSLSTDWVDVEIPFSLSDSDWDCLYSRSDKTHIYGCSSSIASALSREVKDFWIFNYMDTTTTTIPTIGSFDIDSVELWWDTSNTIENTPLIIHSPTNNQYISGRTIKVSWVCNSGSGSVFIAVWNNTTTAPCTEDLFSGTLEYTGNGGNIAVAVRPSNIIWYTQQINTLINPMKTPLTLTNPVSGWWITGRSILFSGKCDRTEGKVTFAVWYDSITVPCSNSDTYGGTLNYTGNGGNIAYGIRSEIDPSYRLTGQFSINTETVALTLSTPTLNQVITNRDITLSWTCSQWQWEIVIVVGYNVARTSCNSNNTFSGVVRYNQWGNGNVAAAIKYTTSASYVVQRNVLISIAWN